MFKNTKSADEIARNVATPGPTSLQTGTSVRRAIDGVKGGISISTDQERAKYDYEKETKKILDRLVSDCDRRIRIATERVELEKERKERECTGVCRSTINKLWRN